MILRAASPADVSALSRLGIDSFVAKFGHLYQSGDLATFLETGFSIEAIAAEVANVQRRYCLAVADGRLEGYCKLGLICGFPEHARGRRPIELKQIYTDPERTGQGIGALLMDWALAEAKVHQADEMQLSVWSGNTGAQRFYARYGFEKVADVDFWVGTHRDDELLLSKLL